MDLSNNFEQAIENESRATSVDRVETRACASDRFDGVQYKIYGEFVSVRPIISVVADVEGHAIEQLYHCTDGEEPHLGVFVAELPEQPHPAFV